MVNDIDDFTTATEDELWLQADNQARLLVDLLQPDSRKVDRAAPYWLILGITVGRLEAITRELSQRASNTP